MKQIITGIKLAATAVVAIWLYTSFGFWGSMGIVWIFSILWVIAEADEEQNKNSKQSKK